MDNLYLVKDLARISGYSVHTVKYYLKIGLIKEEARSPRTNYRFFNDNTLEKLSDIRQMRIRKMSIADIQETLKNTGE